mmetsp:Transcript_2083/g.3612  ORF Transcript_2083/g.3612 Transcript_2083/m.3612 type:complete len:211 (-) Transcript_2083:727-1359(-)
MHPVALLRVLAAKTTDALRHRWFGGVQVKTLGLRDRLPGGPRDQCPRQGKAEVGSEDAWFHQGPDRDGGGDAAHAASDHKGHCRAIGHALLHQAADKAHGGKTVKVGGHADKSRDQDGAKTFAAKELSNPSCGVIDDHQGFEHVGDQQPFHEEQCVLHPCFAEDSATIRVAPEFPDRFLGERRFGAAAAANLWFLPQWVRKDRAFGESHG